MAAKTQTAPHPLAAKADELGALEKEYALLIAPFKQKSKRLEELKNEFREACTAADDSEWRVAGAQYDVILSARATWRAVNLPKLIKLIKLPAFLRIAQVTIKALEAACSAEVCEAVVTKKAIGPRTLTTIEKGV